MLASLLGLLTLVVTVTFAPAQSSTASFQNTGVGCFGESIGGPASGSGQPELPTLTSPDLPILGTTMTLNCSGTADITSVVEWHPHLLIGGSSVEVPIPPLLTPSGATDCSLLVEPFVTIPMPMVSPTAYATSYDLIIPQNTALVGVTFYAQMFDLVTVPSFGLSSVAWFSDRAEMTVGS